MGEEVKTPKDSERYMAAPPPPPNAPGAPAPPAAPAIGPPQPTSQRAWQWISLREGRTGRQISDP